MAKFSEMNCQNKQSNSGICLKKKKRSASRVSTCMQTQKANTPALKPGFRRMLTMVHNKEANNTHQMG